MTHLDTSFLVDLLREGARQERGPAHALLETLADEPIAVSAHVACELYAGAAVADQPDEGKTQVRTLLGALDIVHTDDRFPTRYAEVLADLRKRGQTIATMDLLISVAALERGAALVTRNARDFDRVPGLIVRGY